MTEQETTNDGAQIVNQTGVHEKDSDRHYWKVLQRIEHEDEYRVRASVWSFDPESENVHRDQTSDLNVPVHIWNQLLHDAREKGLFQAGTSLMDS